MCVLERKSRNEVAGWIHSTVVKSRSKEWVPYCRDELDSSIELYLNRCLASAYSDRCNHSVDNLPRHLEKPLADFLLQLAKPLSNEETRTTEKYEARSYIAPILVPSRKTNTSLSIQTIGTIVTIQRMAVAENEDKKNQTDRRVHCSIEWVTVEVSSKEKANEKVKGQYYARCTLLKWFLMESYTSSSTCADNISTIRTIQRKPSRTNDLRGTSRSLNMTVMQSGPIDHSGSPALYRSSISIRRSFDRMQLMNEE